ncbi:MAG TPA: hypothetical protein VGR08_03410 [Thermomicrobiales bacterium]|nr:hypothetical protein [Thermomicrobiales bacterium]
MTNESRGETGATSLGQPAGVNASTRLPETPHDLPVDRARIDALLDRVRSGEQVTLLDEFLAAVDWRSAFVSTEGGTLDLEDISRLIAYYGEKFQDIGPVYLAELMSTEFMTEQRGRGDIVFSERLLELGRNDPDLWKEIRQFFRRKEFATAILVHAHREREEE